MSPFERVHSSILKEVVHYLREKYMGMEEGSFTLDELLQQIGKANLQLDRKQILLKEMIGNPRVKITSDEKFLYNPPLPVRNEKELRQYLKQCYKKGPIGTLVEDVMASMPCAETVLRNLENKKFIRHIERTDKQRIVFYRPHPRHDFLVDDCFKEMYDSLNMLHTDVSTVEKYLHQSKLKPLEAVKLVSTVKHVKQTKQRRSHQPKDNKHVEDLQNYFETLDAVLTEKPSQKRRKKNGCVL